MPNHRLYVSPNSGFVGIGTSYPDASLHIQQQGTEPVFRVDDQHSSTSAFMIDPTGNVGIGTDTPAHTLDVTGDINFTGSLLSNGVAFIGDGSKWTESGSNISYVTGNVGIGTDTPAHTLDVTGDINFTGSLLSNGVAFVGGGDGDGSKWTESGSNISYVTGNVGIGTANPTQRLTVDGDILATGDVTAFSDERQKFNIQTIENSLEKVEGIRGVYFNRISDSNMTTPKRYVGVIAQEVEKVLPEVVHTNGDEQLGIKSVAYANMVGLLCEAIKSLKKELDEEKKQHEHTMMLVQQLQETNVSILERLSSMEPC
jgi:hypothetical protein